ncbi:MAG: O-antigen ligase family protein [Thermomicrobiales bacterium]|nr:O-antigen ligase family protein [Thermomicrobiales bacterium]
MATSAARVALPAPGTRLPLVVGVATAATALASSLISPLLMPIVAAMAILAIVLLRYPWLSVALLVASVPVQQIGAVSGLTATRVALLVAIACTAASLLVARESLRGTRLVIPFLTLLTWMGFTIAIANHPGAAAAELFRWSTALVAFVLVMHFLLTGSRNRILGFVAAIAIAGALESLAGTVLGLIGFGPASFAVAGSISRAYGSFGRPNSFAGFLEMSLFPALWLAVYMLSQVWTDLRDYRVARLRGFATSREQRKKLLWSSAIFALLGGSAAVMLLGVLISFSRGAWLGVAAGLAVSGLLALRHRVVLVIAAAPIVTLLGLLVLASIAPASLTDRLASIADEARPFNAASIPITPENFAVVERMAHWQAGWNMFEDHPLTGVGIGNFNARYPDYFVRTEFRYSQGHAHNYYIHTLAETGMIGLVLYLTLAGSFLILAAMVAVRSTDLMARFVAIGAAGTMTAVYVHNVFEDLHVLNLGILISSAWALAVVAHRLSRASVTDVEYSPE